MIITGTLNAYGKPRDGTTRLLRSAYPGDNFILVPDGLDWKEGDILGLAPTNIDARSYETVII